MNLFNQYCSHEWILHMQGDGKETWICFQQKGPRKKPHAPKHTLQNMRHFAPELQKQQIEKSHQFHLQRTMV